MLSILVVLYVTAEAITYCKENAIALCFNMFST